MAKKEINREEFKKLVIKEAKKYALELEKEKTQEALNKLNESTIKEEQMNELFGSPFKKAKKEFQAKYANELAAINKAYKAYDQSYVELSKQLLQKAKSEASTLAKKHGLSGSDIKVLYKDLVDLVQPMDYNTFSRQAQQGGASMKDIASGAAAGRQTFTANENTETKKKRISESEFRDIVRTEAEKFKKKLTLESEKRALESELKSLNENEIEEVFGLFGGKKNEMSPEEAIEAGREIVNKNRAKKKMEILIQQRLGDEVVEKFYEFVGNNPEVRFPKWDKEQGEFVDGTIYSDGGFSGAGRGGSMFEGEEMEEGIMQKFGLKDDPQAIAKRKDAITKKLADAKTKGYTKFQYDGENVDENTLLAKAEKNGFSGKLIPVPAKATLVYKPGAYGLSRLGSGGASGGLGV